NLTRDSHRVNFSLDRCRVADYRYIPSPFDSSPPAPMLADVVFEVFPEILESALERFGSPRGQSAKRMSGPEKLRLGSEFLDIAGLTAAFFDSAKSALTPSQSGPARSTPAAGLLGEKAFQVPYHSDWARLIIEHDHRAGAHTAPGLLDFREIH